jgi:hypothetical protein
MLSLENRKQLMVFTEVTVVLLDHDKVTVASEIET